VEDFRNQIKSMYVDPTVDVLFENHGPVFVKADKERVTQIVTNLIHNALKFTSDGDILITLAAGEKEVTVSVKDTGLGIDTNIMSSLFTKFTTWHHSGMGVGLYISKNIVETHGGKIWGGTTRTGRARLFHLLCRSKTSKL